MLVIRALQLASLAEAERERGAAAMCEALRELFSGRLAGLDVRELAAHVARVLDRAAAYGLRAERDCARFLNLAVVLGWDFDTRPENAWMQTMLKDPETSVPADRLGRLIAEVIYQAECDEHDARLRAEFEGATQARLPTLVLPTKD